jgi:hypothetical protein
LGNGSAFPGKVSLWTATLGIIVPVSLAVLVLVVVLYLTPQSRMGPVYANEGVAALAGCGVLFVILELVALVCGTAGRHTAPGKAGLLISSVLLFLVLILAGLAAFSALRSAQKGL